MNPTLALLLSDLYDGALAPEHLADLRKSGLTDPTMHRQKIRSVPPDLIDRLLGFPTPKVTSAYLIPFADPRGGWMDHIRLKVFPPHTDAQGRSVKYLQPKRSGVRLYFPLVMLPAVRQSTDPLYMVEGEKKALAVAQTNLPTVGLCGIDGWHVNRSAALHPDLDDVGFDGRVVHVLPDADHPPPPAVAHILRGLAEACTARGASEVLVHIASEVLRYTPACDPGIDDDLVRP
jgi:hypothetical protein